MGEPLVSSWFLLAETTFQLRIPNSSIYTQVSILPEKVSISFGKSANWYHYVARRYTGMGRDTLFAIEADFIEQAIVKKLFEKLQLADIGDLEVRRKSVLQEKAARVKKLERDIETIDEEVATLTENMGIIKTISVIEQLEARIAKLLVRKAEAEDEIATITQAYNDIAIGTIEEELADLEQFWHERSFGLRKALLKLLIKRATLDYISPRFFSVTIEWEYGEWGMEQAIFDKGTSNKAWTEDETTILTNLYPSCPQLEIMHALPTRSWRSILAQAGSLHLQRAFQTKTIKDLHISIKDMEFLERSGLTLNQFRNGNGVIWSILLLNTSI
jgi:hypothetical protein